MNSTRSIFAIAAVLMVAASSPVMASGPFFDDFDFYADQAAFNSSNNWSSTTASKGTLDSSIALGKKSLKAQQAGTEARPNRELNTNPTTGRVDVWFYDDGADIKAFDLAVTNDAVKVTVGLRDNQVGVDTNYVADLNGTLQDTGIARSVGWHLAQFAVAPGGTTIQVDMKDFPNNTVAAMTGAKNFTVFTNLGNPSDANEVWIDTFRWQEGDGVAVLPASVRVGCLEHFEDGIANWGPLTGTLPEDLHHEDDNGGSDGSAFYIDVYDASGPRGFQGNIPDQVPVHGNYRVEFDFGNFWNEPGWEPWQNLTVTINGLSSKNVGSTDMRNWNRDVTSPAVEMVPGTTVNIQVTADPGATQGFVRFDRFYLLLDSFVPPVTAVDVWQLY